MNRKVLVIPAAIFFVVAFSSAVFSQPIGKIYTVEEANKLFGKAIDTVTMAKSNLLPILKRTQKNTMFKIANKELIILGDGRKVLYPKNKIVKPDDRFHFFSKSKVLELMKLSNSTKVHFETRQNTLTITSGINTLEEAMWCPPFCP